MEAMSCGMTGNKVLNRNQDVTGVCQGLLPPPLEVLLGRCWLGERSQGLICIQGSGHDGKTRARWPGFTV